MDDAEVVERLAVVGEVLRGHGALFAYLFGSRARGTARDDSDLDVAAYFGSEKPPQSFDVLLPSALDLLVLDAAPLELRGRVSLEGRLLFAVDDAARVTWEATTRKIYFDERSRLDRAHREFLDAVRHG